MTTHRQPKLSRESIRALLLETGRRLLVEEGLGTGVDTLTFKRVFERVEADTGRRLSNASVIRRVWENQADYQADVLATIASQDGLGEFGETFAALVPCFDIPGPLDPRGAPPFPPGVLPGRRGGQHPGAAGVPGLVVVDLRVGHGHGRPSPSRRTAARAPGADPQRPAGGVPGLHPAVGGRLRRVGRDRRHAAPGTPDGAPVHRGHRRVGRGMLPSPASRPGDGRHPPTHRARTARTRSGRCSPSGSRRYSCTSSSPIPTGPRRTVAATTADGGHRRGSVSPAGPRPAPRR